MADGKSTQEDNSPKLTQKQLRFCQCYVKCLNATQAAKDAGYSAATAYAIGWENLRKPEIRAFIDEMLKENAMTADETTKRINDLARANLTDYFVKKEVPHTPMVMKPLKLIIAEKKSRIQFEEEYLTAAGLKGKEKTQHNNLIKQLKKELFRDEFEYKKHPKATRLVSGEPMLIETMELDLIKLASDKEKGLVKSISHNQYGIKVEMYGADNAVYNLAKMHGLFEKDNDQLKPNVKQFFMIGDKKIEF